jgi:hypothetical protein
LATDQTPFENIFDVSTDVLSGGCTPDQITQLNLAFTECIQMVTNIQNGIGAMSLGLDYVTEPEEANLVWMFTYFLALPGTEKRAIDEKNGGQSELTIVEINDYLGSMTGKCSKRFTG